MARILLILVALPSILLTVVGPLTSVNAALTEVPELSSQSSTAIGASSASTYGDFNNDGFDDLAVGVPFEDISGKSDAGAVNVIYGSSSGLQAAGISGPNDQFWHQDGPSILDSTEAGDLFGSSLAAGDFNGDGYDDLAIGAPFEDIGTIDAAGAVNVIYGSSSGLRGDPAGDGTGRNDQFWHQNSASVNDSAEPGDGFGFSLTTGDFNGDSRVDLAIGVPLENVGSIGDAGAVNVLYGSASGLSATTKPDQFWTQNSADVNDSAESGDLFGDSIAAGDFNNDGRDDLVVGVPSENIGSIPDAGAVNAIYGSASGLSATAKADQFWHQNSASVNDSAEGGDLFGDSLAAGDFNNDGRDDLAVGVPFEDVTGDIVVALDAGAVNVIYGSASGLSATAKPDQFWNQDSSGVEEGINGGDRFGASVVAGDYNDDGRDDLAIGVPFEDVDGLMDAGAVNALYGSGSGLQTSSPADQFGHQNSADVEDSAEASDLFGLSLASGDYNNDGRDDLSIGVPFEDVDGTLDAGAVNVIYGSASGLSMAIADQFWHQNTPSVEDVIEASDLFGFSMT